MPLSSATEPLSLATRLRTATAEVHQRAENSTFMGSLLGEGLDQDRGVRAFSAMQYQYLPVYSALETAVRAHAASPAIAALVDPRLERAGALRNDVDSLSSLTTPAADGPGAATLTPATLAYVRELDELAARGAEGPSDEAAAALVGHHYVRYLGDLSGGQVIARLVGRSYGVPEEALSFYTFDIAKPKVYKDSYRESLDALPLDERLTEIAMDAASRAFDHNTALFRSLEHFVRP